MAKKYWMGIVRFTIVKAVVVQASDKEEAIQLTSTFDVDRVLTDPTGLEREGIHVLDAELPGHGSGEVYIEGRSTRLGKPLSEKEEVAN